MFIHLAGVGFRLTSDTVGIVLILQMIYTIFTIPQHIYSIPEFGIDDADIYINLLIQLVVVYFCYIYVKRFIGIKVLGESFVWIIASIQILGLIVFIGGLAGFIEPVSSYTAPGSRLINNYLLSFSPPEAVTHFDSGSLIRIAGFFDEPGTNAFYIITAIVINRLYGYSRTAERILFIGGVATLSLAFFISAFVFYFFLLIMNRKYISFSIFLVLFLITFTAINEYKDKSDFTQSLYELTVYRVQTDNIQEEKLFAGDNRSQNFRASIDAFAKAPLFGYGKNAHSNPKSEFYGKLCCNPMHPFATEGIVGVIVYFQIIIMWTLLVWVRGHSNGTLLVLWLIIALNLAQRPGFHHGALGYFVFILLLEATRWRIAQSKLFSLRGVWVPEFLKKPVLNQNR